ncbi:response regulator transcription factor [Prolixibacteraceae bacterium JC049]|nr:response regulator transcription factor [Prolixibacteraceae bacterium JC049]
MKILLIEDEIKVSAFIKRGLENERYIVEVAQDGIKGLEMAHYPSFDLIILDLMLPGIDGFTLLRQLREAEIHTPLLILSAKDAIEDRIHGLNLGADDYLSKPFSFGELLARVRALLRRSSTQSNNTTTIKDLKINLMTHEVFKGNEQIELTAKEYALLEFFINNANRAINRITIAEHVWRYDFDPGTNFVDVYINRLRKKIKDTGENKLIHTVRGYGYILKT